MTPEAKMRLRNLLTSHESYRQFPYTDTTGHLTIGIGRNLTDRGISTNEALMLLDDDISYFSNKLSHYLPCFTGLDSNRQIALVDMCFNLGVQGFLGFTSMIQAIENKDWKRAYQEILNSKLAQQNPERTTQSANIILTGEI